MSDIIIYVDPACPWAWRGYLWLREVREQRPLALDLRIFSLKEVNRQDKDNPESPEALIEPAELAMVLARRLGGDDAIERLYLALGKARHERRENLSTHSVIEAALEEAGLDRHLLQKALDDRSVHEEAAAEHRTSVEKYEAFGVPWLVFPGRNFGFYGPIVNPVPEGAAALELWSHVEWLFQQPYLYEIKRERP
jgi:predicted DsbA family dithiol-disulfide isomerase